MKVFRANVGIHGPQRSRAMLWERSTLKLPASAKHDGNRDGQARTQQTQRRHAECDGTGASQRNHMQSQNANANETNATIATS